MIAVTLAPRDRRALTLAGCAAGTMLLWSAVISPYAQALRDAHGRLQNVRELLQKEQQVVAEASGYPAAWDTGSARLLGMAPRLLGGANDGASSAALAGYIQNAAEASGVLIVQLEPLTSQSVGGEVTAVGVRLRGEGDLEGVLSLLGALENGPKLVRVGELRIELTGGSTWDAASPEVLSFQLSAQGYTLGDTLARTAGHKAIGRSR